MTSKRWGAAALLVGALVLTACTSTGPATVPEVVWDPAPPSGGLEADPWAQAVRASDLALSIAGVTHDYTSDALADTTAPSTISQSADAQRRAAENERYYTYPGPIPTIILAVDDRESSATVTVCQAQQWFLDADQSSVPDPMEGKVTEYEVTLTDDDRRIVDGGVVQTEECDIDAAAVGTFDPQPDPGATYAPDDVKGP